MKTNKKTIVLAIIMILIVGAFATTAIAASNSDGGGFFDWLKSFFGITSGDGLTGKATSGTSETYLTIPGESDSPVVTITPNADGTELRRKTWHEF